MANATDSRSVKNVSAVRSRESVNASSAFLPKFHLSSSSLDSHMRRTYPVESIVACTHRQLSLAEWHPAMTSTLYVVPLWVPMRETIEHEKVLSLLARDEDGIENIAVSEDLIWSPVAFSWCPEYILQ